MMDVPVWLLKETCRDSEGEGKTCRPRSPAGGQGRFLSPALCLLLCLCALCFVSGVTAFVRF